MSVRDIVDCRALEASYYKTWKDLVGWQNKGPKFIYCLTNRQKQLNFQLS